MEVPGKIMVLGVVISAVAGGLIEHQFNATEVIKTVDRDVIKYKIITRTHEVTLPDGTKTSDTTTTDNSEEQRKIISTITESKSRDWLVAAGAGINANRVKIYSLSVDRRILGFVTVGAYGTSNSELGLRLGVTF